MDNAPSARDRRVADIPLSRRTTQRMSERTAERTAPRFFSRFSRSTPLIVSIRSGISRNCATMCEITSPIELPSMGMLTATSRDNCGPAEAHREAGSEVGGNDRARHLHHRDAEHDHLPAVAQRLR